jgi:hypothetical protein
MDGFETLWGWLGFGRVALGNNHPPGMAHRQWLGAGAKAWAELIFQYQIAFAGYRFFSANHPERPAPCSRPLHSHFLVRKSSVLQLR